MKKRVLPRVIYYLSQCKNYSILITSVFSSLIHMIVDHPNCIDLHEVNSNQKGYSKNR